MNVFESFLLFLSFIHFILVLFTDSFHAFFSSFMSPTVILNMYCFATVKKGFVFLQPRLRALFLLNRRAPKGSSQQIEGCKRDDKGVGDPKSEKGIFSRFFENMTITLKSFSISLFFSLRFWVTGSFNVALPTLDSREAP